MYKQQENYVLNLFTVFVPQPRATAGVPLCIKVQVNTRNFCSS